jgi:hypothetical protein
MHCGQDCPFCYGTMGGEYCILQEIELNIPDISYEEFVKLPLSEKKL